MTDIPKVGQATLVVTRQGLAKMFESGAYVVEGGLPPGCELKEIVYDGPKTETYTLLFDGEQLFGKSIEKRMRLTPKVTQLLVRTTVHADLGEGYFDGAWRRSDLKEGTA